MSNRFIEKLGKFAVLDGTDIAMLEAATAQSRKVAARRDLISEGDRPGPVFVMISGWACRYNVTSEGGRQISAFLMPGDFSDMHVAVLAEMDHGIQTLTEAQVAKIDREQMKILFGTSGRIADALWLSQLVDQGTMRAWIVGMGRRTALAKVAHLLCELYLRADNVGLVRNGELVLPLTQIVLADALGLTPVHVNRVIRSLRLSEAIELRNRELVISDPAQLIRIAAFDANYLHRRERLVG